MIRVTSDEGFLVFMHLSSLPYKCFLCSCVSVSGHYLAILFVYVLILHAVVAGVSIGSVKKILGNILLYYCLYLVLIPIPIYATKFLLHS